MESTGYPLPTALQTALNIVAFFFPLMLYALWSTLAFADLARRDDLSGGARAGWSAAILLLPWIGPAGYHLAARPRIPGSVRVAMIGGGIAAYLGFLLVGRLLGGVT